CVRLENQDAESFAREHAGGNEAVRAGADHYDVGILSCHRGSESTSSSFHSAPVLLRVKQNRRLTWQAQPTRSPSASIRARGTSAGAWCYAERARSRTSRTGS